MKRFWCGLWLLLLMACRPKGFAAPTAIVEAQRESTSPPATAESISTTDPYREAREQMVRTQIAARGVQDARVLQAMRQVPRHAFVPSEYLDEAYADHPLPIGFGQTISQPYIVALMTEALHLSPGDRVLEIGTGSGYQAAVLAALGAEVYSIEIIPPLATQARQRLRSLGYAVQVRNADGYFGWPEVAPFQAIIVTAAPDHLPQPLAEQLAEGGRMVVPIGPPGSVQTLWLFEKRNGSLQATNLGAVRFVPFLRQWP